MRRLTFSLLVFCLFLSASPAQNRTGYYRMPAIHGSTIVFTSEGDLWTVPITGGAARRLTTHRGVESDATISPDGRTVAFTAQYDGPAELYTMPMGGGIPQRRTFTGHTSIPVGWTNDGKLLYRTQRYSTLPDWQLVVLDVSNGTHTVVPLAQAAQGSYDRTGRVLYFTRLAFQGSFTKRYKGGTAQNIWKFDTDSPEAVPLTADFPGTSKDAMWWNKRVYFVSDRDGIMNIWSMKEDGTDLLQHTRHATLDISYPSLHDGKIAYQLVSDLRVFDIGSNTDTPVNVSLPSDFDQMRERWVEKPMDFLSSLHLSPDGERIVLTSRGKVFVVPTEQGRIVQASREEGVRNRFARFFPDGTSLLVISDQSGENEFHRMPADGLGATAQLTKNGKVIRFDGEISPDGSLIAYSDKNYQLWVHTIASGESKLIATSTFGMAFDLTWSPDGKWLAFTDNADNLASIIRLYSVSDGSMIDVTNDRTDSWSPAWSADGKWLYFLSDRTFRTVVGSPWGSRQPDPYFDKKAKIYAIGLTKDEVFPFLPDNELRKTKDEKKEEGKKEKDDTKDKQASKVRVTVEADGLQERLYEVPLDAGNYRDLAAGEKVLFFTEVETAYGGKRALKGLEIKNNEPKDKTLVEEIAGYELSGDLKKIGLRKGNDVYVFDAGTAAPTPLSDKKVDLSKWSFSFDPRAEWKQMFTDAWRLERDYFYDRNLHGVDYDGLYQRYLPFVERVSDRDELADLLGHLVGELSALHTFVYGGDVRRGDENVAAASLGARLTKDAARNGWRVEYIYRTSPEFPEALSPLARPHVAVREGDVIQSVDGVPTLSVEDPAILLRNKAGRQVMIEVISPGQKAARRVVVEPMTAGAESNLRYDDWEYARRMMTDRLSSNDVGYVHLRAMGGGNMAEWMKNFYPVFNRKGLIIDVRHNRGGNIDSWILGKLLRKAWFYWQPRVGDPYWNMQYAFRGHMVVLCNERTASDGEAFAEGFRRLGLGSVIGTRTWGGEIWLSSGNRLVDKGIATAAEYGVYGPERAWLIEGHGVDPDIVVDNLPHATFNGRDSQLEKAVQFLKERIQSEPVDVPAAPAHPKMAPERKN